jgi:HrpA-like RNA helicase
VCRRRCCRSLPAERLEWLVPGLLEAKCIALVRNLPKALRKNFVPVPDFVKAALQRMVPLPKARCRKRWAVSCCA